MENINMTTAMKNTAFEQKWVTTDLIESLKDAMAIRIPDTMLADVGVVANKQVRKALAGLIAAKAYLWMVSYPEHYGNIIRSKEGCVKSTHPDLQAAGFNIDLYVNGSHLRVNVMDGDHKPLFEGECDLNESL